jgi:ribosomal protein L25 (general stress protein Ctc)
LNALGSTTGPAPRYYQAKAEISFRNNTESRSFKAHIRMVRDSAAWLSVVPALGIEVARALLMPDSLLLLDKLHDTYWTGDTADVRRKFGIELNLVLLQDALLGRPAGLDPEEKYRSDREDGAYTLTSRERRRFVRAAEDLSPGDTLPNDKDMRGKKLERTLRKAGKKEAVVYKYWIDPDSLCVERVQISDLAHDRLADVRYVERVIVDGNNLPASVLISLSAPGQTASGSLRLDRIELNGPLNLPFRIPEKFKPME